MTTISHPDLVRFVYETGSPFRRLEALLSDIEPAQGLPPITMTVGAPRHAPPLGLTDAVVSSMSGFGQYPAITGTDAHRGAIGHWINRRYGLDPKSMEHGYAILPLNGSREGLVLAARCARDRSDKRKDGGRRVGERPVIVMQNPFYQAYVAGALAADCEVVLLDEHDLTGASLDISVWSRTVAAYIASPTNPQGAVLSVEDWQAWIERAREHDFMLFADECYSEIYRFSPPPGALEAAAQTTGGFGHVVAFNSLSKRSNLPGLRSGFVAGDPAFLADFMKLRNMGGPQVPLPVQAASNLAWADEAHVKESRALYTEKWALVDAKLGQWLSEATPPAGFFLWLKLPEGVSDIDAAKTLWRTYALRTIPGSFMAYPTDEGPTAADRLRLALVDDEPTTLEALDRLSRFFDTVAPVKAMAD
ncbi:MAG: aminotransferase class I/II-fold pyridoxal phosphate-dependent enzyme [Pseudomonadota bacterium]